MTLALVFALWGPAEASSAETDVPLSVAWSGETCAGPTLTDRVERYLASAQGDTRSATAADVHLHRDTTGVWRLELDVSREGTQPGHRSFAAEDCGTVVDAAAFVLAVAMDPTVGGGVVPDASADEPEAEPESQSESEAEAEAEPEAEPASKSESESAPASEPKVLEPIETPRPGRRPRAVKGFAGAGVGPMGGALPSVGAAFEGNVGVMGRYWRVGVGGVYRFESEARSDQDPDAGGLFSLWAVALRGCGVPHVGPVELPVCALVEGGQLVGEGFGFLGAKTTRLPWGAAGGIVGVAWSPRPFFAVSAEVHVAASLSRASWVIEGLDTVHTVGPVFGRGFVGLEARFP